MHKSSYTRHAFELLVLKSFSRVNMANLILRPATRAELPLLARIQNAANAHSALHHQFVPGQLSDPESYYRWTLLRQRIRFVTPSLRFIVAEDATTHEVLGLSVWCAQGNSKLNQRWEGEVSRLWSLERALLDVEMKYHKYVEDKIIDWRFLDLFLAEAEKAGDAIPPCLHLWVLEVTPNAQYKGVGKALMGWGRELARQEGLPFVLESNLEATGFYGKVGMKRVDDLTISKGEGKDEFKVPCFAWEPEDGVFLEEGDEGRWRWRRRDVPSRP
jgi:GNAT superfamily N-acetyltransferase